VRSIEAEGEEMKATKLQELEEIAAKLLATAGRLPPGQDRYNALREIGKFRARIVALEGPHLRRWEHQGPKAKGK
jgi:hypothetical protein